MVNKSYVYLAEHEVWTQGRITRWALGAKTLASFLMRSYLQKRMP